MSRTPEQIAELAEPFEGLANIARINREYRRDDESHLWPICNKFDVTERAIRRVRRQGYALYGLEYAYAIDHEISNIVNSII